MSQMTAQAELVRGAYSFKELHYEVQRHTELQFSERTLRRWMKYSYIRTGRAYSAFELAKLIFFGCQMKRFDDYQVCRELLAEDLKLNGDKWRNFARSNYGGIRTRAA